MSSPQLWLCWPSRVATAHCVHPGASGAVWVCLAGSSVPTCWACGDGVLLTAIFKQGVDIVTIRLIIAGQERAAAYKQEGEHSIGVLDKDVVVETSIGPGCCPPRSGSAGEPRLSLFA